MSKIERALENLSDSISDYEELDEHGRMYMLDEMIEVLEDMYSKGLEEGHRYSEMMCVIRQGEELMKPFTTMHLRGFSDTIYKVYVTTISSMSWNKDGNLVVNFLGRKI